jgi:hypothetical protein
LQAFFVRAVGWCGCVAGQSSDNGARLSRVTAPGRWSCAGIRWATRTPDLLQACRSSSVLLAAADSRLPANGASCGTSACRLDGSDPGPRGASPISVRKPRSRSRPAPRRSQPIAPRPVSSPRRRRPRQPGDARHRRHGPSQPLGVHRRGCHFHRKQALVQWAGLPLIVQRRRLTRETRDSRSQAQGEARRQPSGEAPGPMLRS